MRDTERDGHEERQRARHTDRERGEANNTAAARINLNEGQTETVAQVRVNGKMEIAQVKVNGDTDQTTPTGLQDLTDEQLAAELESRGFEVWKWPREKDWKQ